MWLSNISLFQIITKKGIFFFKARYAVQTSTSGPVLPSMAGKPVPVPLTINATGGGLGSGGGGRVPGKGFHSLHASMGDWSGGGDG